MASQPSTQAMPTGPRFHATSLRIDRTIGDRLTIFGRYNYSPSENVQRGGTGYSLSLVAPSRIITQTGTAGATWKFSDRSVNDFRFNFSRTNAQASDSIDSFGGAVPLPSLPFPSPYSVGNAQLFVDIFSLTGGYLVAGANLTSNLDQINLVDSLSLERGTHAGNLEETFDVCPLGTARISTDRRPFSPTFLRPQTECWTSAHEVDAVPLFISTI